MSDSHDAIGIVQSFIRCFNENRIADALDCLSDDVLYHNIPMAPMNGRAAVSDFMVVFDLGGALKTEWEILAISGVDDVVLTERVDYFYRAGGPRLGIPIMGSFRIRAGRIAEWRDYFDLAEFERIAAQLGSQ